MLFVLLLFNHSFKKKYYVQQMHTEQFNFSYLLSHLLAAFLSPQVKSTSSPHPLIVMLISTGQSLLGH